MSKLSFATNRADFYLVIPDLRIDDVSAGTSSFVAGPPSPVALCGFAHKVGLDLVRDGIVAEAEVKGSAMVSHGFEIAAGHRRIPPEMRGEENAKAGAMIDDPTGRFRCSLLVGIDSPGADLDRVADWFAATLRSRRLGGGRFVSSGLPGRAGERAISKPVVTCPDVDSLRDVIRRLPAGVFLRDRGDLLPDGGDRLDALLDAVCRTRKPATPSTPAAAWTRKQKGCVVPIDIGYRALSSVARRRGMRAADGVVGHAWAESIVSLGEWVPKGRALYDGLGGCLWSHRTDQADRGIWTVAAPPLPTED